MHETNTFSRLLTDLDAYRARYLYYGDEDGEGALLQAIRDKIGPDVPICVSLDLHANVTQEMASNANGLFSFRTYPHVDTYDTGKRAAAALQAAIADETAPKCLAARRPQIDGANHGCSQDGPMIDLLKRCETHGKEAGTLDVSVNGGFLWADIEWAGPSVTVTYDAGAEDRAREIAESMMDTVWDECANVTIRHLPVNTAMDLVKAAGTGDNPTLLAAMIAADLQDAAFGTISDPEAVRECQRAGVNGDVRLDLGGKIDSDFVPPIRVEGEVVAVSDGGFTYEGPMSTGMRNSMGPTAILRVGGIEIIITNNRLQVLDLATFRSQGIDPEEKQIVAVKSAHHFRGAFGPIAREIHLVDALGLATPSLKSLDYQNVRLPVWPLGMD